MHSCVLIAEFPWCPLADAAELCAGSRGQVGQAEHFGLWIAARCVVEAGSWDAPVLVMRRVVSLVLFEQG